MTSLLEPTNKCSAAGGDHHDAPDLITAFLPLFQRYNVDAYIAGHDHTLIHLKAENTQFIVSGGGSRIRNNTVVTPEVRRHAIRVPVTAAVNLLTGADSMV